VKSTEVKRASLLWNFPRVVRLVWESNPKYAAWAFTLTVISSLAVPGQFYATKLIFDQIVPIIQGSGSGSGHDMGSVLAPIMLILILWILGELAGAMQGTVRELLGFEVVNHTCELVLKKANLASYSIFESPEFHDKMQNALRENHRIQQVAFFTLDTSGQILSLGSLLWILGSLDIWFIPILLATSIPQIIIGGVFAGRKYRLLTGRIGALRMNDYIVQLLSSRESKKEVFLLALEGLLLGRYRKNWKRFLAENKKIAFPQQSYNALLGFLSISGTAVIWGMAIRSTMARFISLGDLTMGLQASMEARNSLEKLFMSGSLFYENTLFIKNLFDFLDLNLEKGESERKDPAAHSIGSPAKLGPGPLELEFQDVGFRYPLAAKDALTGINLKLRQGEVNALVGVNGSGKTTLIKLASGLYEPTEGRILLNGRDIREYEGHEVRSRISVAFQDFVQYLFTVEDNIGFGQVDRIGDRERIVRCAEDSGSWDMVRSLPAGLETNLGKVFEDGVDLSGGQWQKLALSRANMREECGLVILDEPTAALDPFAEHEVLLRLMGWARGKTILFISHRFSSVRSAANIFVLDKGRLVEQGSHRELIELEGEYFKMFKLQASAYREPNGREKAFMEKG